MSGNRKVTDFFKRSLTQTGQIHRAGSGADCINVARPSRAARSGSETAGDVIDEEARPEDISSLPPRVSRSDARRVVRHGKVVIKSSDDEGEDSSSSLESLDDLLGISTRLVGSPSDPQRDQQRRVRRSPKMTGPRTCSDHDGEGYRQVGVTYPGHAKI